ncbi:MFS transporter [Microlunatus speluncae]|uniref:MFS transporter n=1 Tax=Microlunatus speluncae TaxID=2594267 RepID=UPI001266576E|nr:MFS transporter [Microlunatus speluncae]
MAGNTYRQLLRSREFCALWVGNALGVASTTMAGLTLATIVYAQTGSAFLTAVAMFGPSTVQLVGALTLMSAADTARPRIVLVIAAVCMAGAHALQAAFDLDAVARVLVLLGASYVLSIGSGTRWGLLSQVLARDAYALGRSAMNLSVGVMQVVGFAAGGALVLILDPRAILWIGAGLAALAIPVAWFGIGDRPARRSGRVGIRETWQGHRALWQLTSVRPLVVALCVPNGLIAGCEALFVPYAGSGAGPLFVAAALGMLAGDVVVGRLLPSWARRRVGVWLSLGLAVPFLIFVSRPGVPVAAGLVAIASVGFAATLAQQELLVELTPPAMVGQVLGADSALRVTAQGLAAVLAGVLAEVLGAAAAITVLAAASVTVSGILFPALRRLTRPAQDHRPDLITSRA